MFAWLKKRIPDWHTFITRCKYLHKSLTVQILSLQGAITAAHSNFPLVQQYLPTSTYAHIMEGLTFLLVLIRIATTMPLETK